MPMPLLNQQQFLNELARVFESYDTEVNPLYDAWACGQFPTSCDDASNGESYASSLSKVRALSLDSEELNNRDTNKWVLLYRNLCELNKET